MTRLERLDDYLLPRGAAPEEAWTLVDDAGRMLARRATPRGPRIVLVYSRPEDATRAAQVLGITSIQRVLSAHIEYLRGEPGYLVLLDAPARRVSSIEITDISVEDISI